MSRADARRAALSTLRVSRLGDRVGDRVEALSHGNQQRAQLAASLVHDPELLVLDEPFSGLDPMGVDTMAEVVRTRADAGGTVLFSSHQLDLVEDLCDDVAIIDHGRVVLAGSLEEVRNRAPHRRLEIAFADHQVAWEPPGGTVLRDRDGSRVFLVPATSDPAALLASASTAGKVSGFGFAPPRLSEVFREAVAP
jgi:ABC-2 type transport system ATP-binding protein